MPVIASDRSSATPGRGPSFAILPSSSPIWAGEATISATPAAIALRGISSNCAVDGSCAKLRPPAARIARNPSVPSCAVPDSTTPTARSRSTSAIDANSASIGCRGRTPGLAVRKTSAPRNTHAEVCGGTTRIVLGSIRCPLATSTTGSNVAAASRPASWPIWDGGRCWRTTNASPVSAGMLPMSCLSASRPPAEAPTPTTRCGCDTVRRRFAMDEATPPGGFARAVAGGEIMSRAARRRTGTPRLAPR